MIELVIDQRRRALGGGFEVRRVLPFAKRHMVGPFIFFDHFGPVDLAPGLGLELDVRAHPHVGLSTVSYLFSGQIMHRDGLTASAKTHSPLFYAHLEMEPGAVAEAPGDHKERALYIAAGAIELHGGRYEAGQMLVLGAGSSHFEAKKDSTVMVLGGEPIGERFIYWNFVSSSKGRLAQAAADWKAGRMKLPDADDAAFIPLPDEPAPPLPAAS